MQTVNNVNINSASTLIELVAGDYIDIRSDGTPTLNFITQANTVSIERLSGPSVIAASETVAYRGVRNAGNYVLNNASANYVPNLTSYDTHAAMNTTTGTYTVPVSGIYEVFFRVPFFTSVTGTSGNASVTMAGETTFSWIAPDSTNVNYRTAVVTASRRMNAGETILAQVFFNSNNATFVGDNANTNIFQIKRIGN
jgi:hypothetical protein